MAAGPSVETPSGKSAETENFPVGSMLIEARLRPHVAAFYDFARAIDDIADNPGLSAEEKLRRLEGFERTLKGEDIGGGFEKAGVLAQSLRETDISTRYGCDLVSAFRQDAVKSRYADWSDLMAYCQLSAAPVGRYLIDLHGGEESLYSASDALCAALQVINHLQDCGEDYRDMDRVYLPMDWMKSAGASVQDLGADTASPALHRVFDQCLAGCRELMADTAPLRTIRGNRRLALESAVIIESADRLLFKLAKNDPLASRIGLSRLDVAFATGRGLLRGIFGGA